MGEPILVESDLPREQYGLPESSLLSGCKPDSGHAHARVRNGYHHILLVFMGIFRVLTLAMRIIGMTLFEPMVIVVVVISKSIRMMFAAMMCFLLGMLVLSRISGLLGCGAADQRHAQNDWQKW
jgi:hypothetical protein